MRALGSHLLMLLCLLAWSVEARSAIESMLVLSWAENSLELPATLIKPDGDGPFPALVVMHDCSGLGPHSSGAPLRWARELVQDGFVVVVPDSFTPRGFADGVCSISGTDSASANGYVRAADAYAALAMLRTLPFVDAQRIGVMGGSHGGWTVLAAMAAPAENDAHAQRKRDGFAAAVALYPSCAPRYGDWSTRRERGARFGPPVSYFGVYRTTAPLLILIGEKDDWTPAEPCRRLAETSRAAGYPVGIKIYPGAHHAFDNDRPVRYGERRNNASSPTGRGATTRGDPAAWADARRQVAAFFALHLKPQP